MARSRASTRGWRPRELSLLVFPVIAVLMAVAEIGDRPPEDRGVAWAWFVAASAAAAIAGARYGARSSLRGVDSAARRLGTMLATSVAFFIGVVVFSFVGGMPRVVALGIVSAFILAGVVVRAYRALGARRVRR
jgi:cation transport ATPase